MKPIAIFYHTCVNIGTREHATQIINEQVGAIKSSGLSQESDWFFVCVNGSQEDVEYVESLLPNHAVVIQNPPETWASGEVQTLRFLRDFCIGNPMVNVLYLHMKGLTHIPGSGTYEYNRDWRHRMQNVVVNNWRHCVNLLTLGNESVGNWWNVAPNGSYWAGNFWWATSDFINTLPPINVEGQHSGGRYEAEVWIGRGPRLPKFVSF